MIERQMMELAQQLGSVTGEASYCTVQVSANINGDLKWQCYTPAHGHSDGKTFEEAMDRQVSKEKVAARFREQAAKLIERADKLEAKS